MIDLSHLTEEEQGMIMAVLMRDAQLKKAEEERISKLEKIQSSGIRLDSQLKYLTGEWFYEVKSRRHMDKIHGSEIILASMKQRKADGSLRSERSKTPSSQGSDIIAPPKPARSTEGLRSQDDYEREKENLNSGIRSPRTPRHNPFNKVSFIAVETPEYNNDMSPSQRQWPTEPEKISPLRSHAPREASQGSITSDASSSGFRPVPRKRTFLTKHTSSESESSLGVDASVLSAGVVPSPRQRLQRGSSGNSDLKGQNLTPQKAIVSTQMSLPPSKSLNEHSQQPLQYIPQALSNSSVEKESNPRLYARERPTTYTMRNEVTEREIPLNPYGNNGKTTRDYASPNSVTVQTVGLQRSERGEGEDLSLPQSTVDPDPPVSYDLNFIHKSDEQMKKSNQRHKFKLSTLNTSPTGDEDSIAKVLDWFSRSTDSNDWLNTEDGTEATKSSEKHPESSKLKGEDSFGKYEGNIISDKKMETSERRGSNLEEQSSDYKELKRTKGIGNKKLAETQELMKDVTEKMSFVDYNEESQQISHLKSSLETSNMNSEILKNKSIIDKGQESAQRPPSVDKGNKPIEIPDFPTLHGIYNWKGNNEIEREQELVPSSQNDSGNIVDLNSNQKIINSSTEIDSDYLKSEDYPQAADRRCSNAGIQGVNRLSPQELSAIQSILSPESENVKANQQSNSGYQALLQDDLSKTMPVSQLSLDLQTKDSSDSEKPDLPKNSPYTVYKQEWNEVRLTRTTLRNRDPNVDVARMESDERMQSSKLPKRNEEISNDDIINNPYLSRKKHQETPAERIRQLRSFWEQDKKPMFYTPKASGDDKVTHSANQARLNKRFTKSEYDLRSISMYSGNNEEDSDENQMNFTVIPMNHRMEESSPSPITSRIPFNILREFWDETTSEKKGLLSPDKPKSPKRKELVPAQFQSLDFKCDGPEMDHEKTRLPVMASSPLQSQAKSPHDREIPSRAANASRINLSDYMQAEQEKESKRSSKDSREKKSNKPQSNSGREGRSAKSRKDSFGSSSSRPNSMGRSSSMFALNVPDEREKIEKVEASPVQQQSRKLRQSPQKSAMRRSSEDTATSTPLARSCVPKDYRHYLGMTDEASLQNSFAPAVDADGSEDTSMFEFDQPEPVRASTPASSEECRIRKGSKTRQRPQLAMRQSSDTGQESSVSSSSEPRSNSRNNSNWETDDEDHPVRKALKRAVARPKQLAKSLEDITSSVSPRQERRQTPNADTRHINNISAIPSSSPTLFSNPDHLKKISKSVPLLLDDEDIGRDTDSNWDNSYRTKSGLRDSFSNLTNSSSMASRSGSVMTMYSGDLSNVEVQGSLQFSINYIQKLKEFHIFVAECRDLAAVDLKRGRSDPYVKSYLIPDKANLGKRKTSVKKKTLNPTFNEILRYRVRMEYLKTKMLILSVWHHDTFGRNSFLGEVDLDLSKWNFSHTQMNYVALKGKTFQTTPSLQPSGSRGEMKLAIRFLPQSAQSEESAVESPNSGEVHIWVKECKNLPLIRTTIDPYVKCFVLPDTSRKSRQKTRVLQRTVDPAFNHTMVYDGIREADLVEACVELTVWDRDKLISHLLGGLRLGVGSGTSYGAMVDWMDSTPYEVKLWERMRASPNEWVEDVLPLRMLNSARTAIK
ncbi:synaptotagmin-like protein 2 isoform X1 [Antennarius striatus]|uniref:synaptotagmin-like protein 2 isoform X1 n=1 Tax=Antennarius striatus TaxID=241820 RepID=UPI0035B2598E